MSTPLPSSSPEEILAAVLALPPDVREAYLPQACKGNAALEAEVRALLAAHDAMPSGFLGQPSLDLEATVPDSERIRRPVLPAPERAGDRIGPYKLLQQIGEGGFGVVWMAEQEQPVRRRVALKVIKLGMDTKEVVSRFEQERQALALMDHPNIARVFDAGATDKGRPYFVMELVRGMKITDFCDEQGLSNTQRIELFIQVCQAVQHAHQKGIIHRDIKPSNILVTVNDGKAVPKVIDFGVAKATQGRLSDGTLFTQFEQMIGTPLYMSPEQADMTSLDVDTRSDIYSLGVLLYELLTGRTPIDTATMAKAGLEEIRRLIREIDPVRPSARLKTLDGKDLTTLAKRRHMDEAKLPGALRGDIDWIVMKCLEKDRQRRYDTANGLALDLQRHLKNEVVIARPPTTAYLLGKLIRRNKAAFAAGLSIAAVLVAGIALTSWQAIRANRALQELRAAAPAFVEQARGLVAREQFDEAIERLDYAIKLQPKDASHLVIKADLFQCQFKLAEAAAIYREALRLQPDHARAGASAKLCEELLAAPPGPDGKLTRESLGKLHLAMQKQQRPAAELLPAARLLGEEKEHLMAYWLERLKDLPISPEKPLKDRLTVREDGLFALNLTGTQITDLTPLVGMPLGKLELWNCGLITDFSPLREFRSLTYLDLDGSQLADLSVVCDLPLEALHIGGTKVSDLSPLRGLKLKTLGLYGCRHVSDLSPLEGMPLTELYIKELANGTDYSPLGKLPLEKCAIVESSVADLSFLAATPLKELGLYRCYELRGFGWLKEIRSLERLILPSNFRDLPEDDLQSIAALRGHPQLAFIQGDPSNNAYEDWRMFQVTQSKDIFWRDWDREQSFLPAIRATGFSFWLSKLADDTYRLEIRKQEALRDLSFLEGAPISILWIGRSQVTDLTAIAKLPLRTLFIHQTPISDLSPLRGSSIEQLSIEGTNVSDLSPLEGLPLKKLYSHSCAKLSDVSVLARIPTLERLTVSINAQGIEKLQDLPNLKWLAFSPDPRDADLLRTTAETFWERWPSMAWSKALNEQGIAYTASEGDDGLWSVTVTSKDFNDCSIFKGGLNRELTLMDTSVADLRPLEELPLTRLDVRRTLVRDLSPLRAPVLSGSLKSLYLHQCNIADFTPLQACTSLEKLDVSDSQMADLSVLRAPKLEELNLQNTKVADISALAGLPLTYLRLDGTPVEDVRPLRQCQKLRSLVLPHNAQNLSELKELPALTALSFKAKSASPLWLPDQKAVDFWQDYKKAGWRTALREAGIVPTSLNQLPDGTWSVSFAGTGFKDLSILRGASISSLDIGNTKVTDLSPLKDLPLTVLKLYNTAVTDLSPLQGKPLRGLQLSGTPVTDLSVLRGMPLTDLKLHACLKLTDLSPLADAKELVNLTLPPSATDLDFLRDFPKLKRLSFSAGRDAIGQAVPDLTAGEFWALRDFATKFPAAKDRIKKQGDGTWNVDLSRIDFANEDFALLQPLDIRFLNLTGTQVTTLEPIKDLQLQLINLAGSKISDISALGGMPLVTAKFAGCKDLHDLSPLAGAKELRHLTLPPEPGDIAFLRTMPKLERISFTEDPGNQYLPDKTAAEFWKEYDAKKPK